MLKLTAAASVLILLYLWRRAVRRRRLIEKLGGKVVIITGASSGVGEACAEVFYKAGAKVVLCARRLSELERVKRHLQSLKLDVTTYEPFVLPLDLTEFDSHVAKVKMVIDLYGRVDILVNNGGVSSRGEVADTLLNVYQRVMDVNFFGQIAITKAVLPYMVAAKSGIIVPVGSIQGLISVPFRSPYGASKHAMQSFFDSLRAEVARDNVRVATICPGYIQTALSMSALTPDGTAHGKMDKTTAAGMPASYVATQILHAVAMRQNEVILSPALIRLVIYARTLVPDLFFKMMQSRAANGREVDPTAKAKDT